MEITPKNLEAFEKYLENCSPFEYNKLISQHANAENMLSESNVVLPAASDSYNGDYYFYVETEQQFVDIVNRFESTAIFESYGYIAEILEEDILNPVDMLYPVFDFTWQTANCDWYYRSVTHYPCTIKTNITFPALIAYWVDGDEKEGVKSLSCFQTRTDFIPGKVYIT